MIDRGRHSVLGVDVNAVDYDVALQRISAAARQRQPLGVSALAVHGVMTGVLDATHRYRLNQLELIVPDGQPVRWALRWLHGAALPDRVYGPTLMLRVCEQAAREGTPVFFYGATEEMLGQLRRRLLDRFPQLKIAGLRQSRFRRLSETERDETVSSILESGAAITFVGLGCPRQEVWAYEFRKRLSMPVLAVGAAFNFHAGALSQAPPLMQRWGLEWLYRLACEPARLWKRYLLLNPLYLSLLALQITRLRRFDSQSDPQPQEEILYG